jgi:hypothetical protein
VVLENFAPPVPEVFGRFVSIKKTKHKKTHLRIIFFNFPAFFQITCFFVKKIPPFFQLSTQRCCGQKSYRLRKYLRVQMEFFQKKFTPLQVKTYTFFPTSNPTIFRIKCASPSNYREASFPSPLENLCIRYIGGSFDNYRTKHHAIYAQGRRNTSYYAKQTQFPKYSKERNFYYKKGLQRYSPPRTPQKQTQFKPNSNPISLTIYFRKSLCQNP